MVVVAEQEFGGEVILFKCSSCASSVEIYFDGCVNTWAYEKERKPEPFFL